MGTASSRSAGGPVSEKLCPKDGERPVKKIEAIIQPHKLHDVMDALTGVGVEGMTVSEVRGHGRQKGHTETYRGHEYKIDLLPKVKLETVVADDRIEAVLTALSASAKSGKIGDGKIFVTTVADAIRIRNGERGETAL